MTLHRLPVPESTLRVPSSLILVALLISATSCGGSSVPATPTSTAMATSTATPTPTPAPTAARAPRTCASAWTTSLVEPAVTGLSPTIALDHIGGLHVSYHDFTEIDLRYAHRAPDGAWTDEIVDSEGSVGYPSSIAADASGRVYVSYYRFDGRDLKLASRAPGEAWAIETVDSEGNIGFESSVAVDRDGRAHIAYYAEPAGGEDDQLRHAVRAPSGEWVIEVVDAHMEDAPRNPRPFLAVDGEGTVHITYLGSREDAPPRLRPILHARRAAGGAWTTESVDRVSSTNVGFEPFMSIDVRGGLHLTYHVGSLDRDHGFRHLMYAHRPAAGSWTTNRLPWPGHVGGEVPVVADAEGSVHVSYLNVAGDTDELHIASGNPADGWERSMVVRAGGAGALSLMGSPIVIDPEGGAHVLYRVERNRLAHAYRPPCGESDASPH